MKPTNENGDLNEMTQPTYMIEAPFAFSSWWALVKCHWREERLGALRRLARNPDTIW